MKRSRGAGEARQEWGGLEDRFELDPVVAIGCLVALNLVELAFFDVPGRLLRNTGVPFRALFHPKNPLLIYAIPAGLGVWLGLRMRWSAVVYCVLAAAAFLGFQHQFPSLTWRVGIGFGVSDGPSLGNDLGTIFMAWIGAVAGSVWRRYKRVRPTFWETIPDNSGYLLGLASMVMGVIVWVIPFDIPLDLVGYRRSPHSYLSFLMGGLLVAAIWMRTRLSGKEA